LEQTHIDIHLQLAFKSVICFKSIPSIHYLGPKWSGISSTWAI
jgi:hypothetical protein